MVKEKTRKPSTQQSRKGPTNDKPVTEPPDARKQFREKLSTLKPTPEIDGLLDRVDRLLARYVDAMEGRYSEAKLMLPLIDILQAYVVVAQSIGNMHPDVASRFFVSLDPGDPRNGLESFLTQFEHSVRTLNKAIQGTVGTGGEHQDRNMRRLLRSLISIWGEKIAPGKGGDPSERSLTEENRGRAFIHAVLKQAQKDGVRFPFKRGKKFDQVQGKGFSDEAIKKLIRKYFSPNGSKSQFDDRPSTVTKEELAGASSRMMAGLNEHKSLLKEKRKKKRKK